MLKALPRNKSGNTVGVTVVNPASPNPTNVCNARKAQYDFAKELINTELVQNTKETIINTFLDTLSPRTPYTGGIIVRARNCEVCKNPAFHCSVKSKLDFKLLIKEEGVYRSM